MNQPGCWARPLSDARFAVAFKSPAFLMEISHGTMPNGETRHKVTWADGSAYIRCEASDAGGWQNAHYHMNIAETIIVQQGWTVVAVKTTTGISFTYLRAGEVFTVIAGRSHNSYLPAGAVTHTVKHGTGPNDWIADPALDAATKGLSEKQVLEWGTCELPEWERELLERRSSVSR